VAGEISNLLKEMTALVPDHFIALYDRQRLAQLPRYIRSLRLKARRAVDNFPAHQQKTAQVAWAAAEFSRLMADLTPHSSVDKRRALEELFWMVEEYKLSVFTQEMKTAFPVSKKRIQERVREIDRMI
jgi:ATP-dependent helicase HrpA